MKQNLVKRKLLTELAIGAAAVVVLAGGTYFLTVIQEEYQQQKTMMENQVTAVNIEVNTLQGKYVKVQRNADLYASIMEKDARDGFALNRQQIRKLFDQYNDRFYLNNMHLSLVSQDMEASKYKRESHSIVASDVKVSFDALTDLDVYEMIDAAQEELSGMAKITRLTLTREMLPGATVIKGVAENGHKPLVKGQMDFTWLGIKPVIKEDKQQQPPGFSGQPNIPGNP